MNKTKELQVTQPSVITPNQLLSQAISEGMEEWRDIPGYEGYYMASSMGRIKSKSRCIIHSGYGKQFVRERILSPAKTNDGYLRLSLSMNGASKSHLVHRLVCFAFYGKSEKEIDHINAIKDDNRLSNLSYCSHRENMRLSHIRKGKIPGVRFTKGRWEAYSSEGKFTYLGRFESKKEAISATKNNL